jgi:hypothetical protein
MRRFTLGAASDRKIVVIDQSGTHLSVLQMLPDGTTKRSEKELSSEAEARLASQQMAGKLIALGYTEQVARGGGGASSRGVPKPPAGARAHEEVDPYTETYDTEAPAALAAPVLARLDVAPGATLDAEGVAKKTKKSRGKKRRKKKKSQSDDALDKRVLAAIAAVGLAFIGFIGFFIYDAFIKPPTIVGVWRGSMLEHEISRRLSLTRYDLILDEQKRAELTLQEKNTMVGTYTFKANRLMLTLEDDEGDPSEIYFRTSLGRSTLKLFDPDSGKLLVELIRFRETPVVRKKKQRPAAGDAKHGARSEPADDESGAGSPSLEQP